MRLKLLLCASAAAFASPLLFAGVAAAQANQAQTVSACGTPNNTPVVGSTYPMTQDTNAKLCTSAVLSGNVTASNPSVGATGSSVPGNATAVGFSNSGGNLTIPSSTNPLPVTTIAGSVANTTLQTQTDTVMVGGVNLKEVNAVTTLTGAGASGTGAQRETVSQDTTTIAGSAPGTAGTASANVVTVQGVASMTPIQVTNTPQGQENYPNRANWVGNTTTIANTTATTVIPSPGAGNSIFVTDYNCSNTGAANVTVTFNDNAGTVLITPLVGGNNLDLQTPREVAGNTALTMTLSANTTSEVCTVSGYKAAT